MKVSSQQKRILTVLGGLVMAALFVVLFVSLETGVTSQQSGIWVFMLRYLPLLELGILIVWTAVLYSAGRRSTALYVALTLLICWNFVDFGIGVIYGAGGAVV